MRTLLAVIVSLTAAAAAQAGDLGSGMTAGDGVSASVKYFMDKTHAVDGGFGLESRPKVYAGYLWNNWTAVPQPKKGRLGTYLGLGGRIDTDESEFGFRPVAGLGYWIGNHPIELAMELAPVFPVDSGAELTGSVGIRYYFQTGRGADKTSKGR